MSEPTQEPTQEPTGDEGQERTQDAPKKGAGYHVSDLPEGATPDPLGDASLTAQERATATSDDK